MASKIALPPPVYKYGTGAQCEPPYNMEACKREMKVAISKYGNHFKLVSERQRQKLKLPERWTVNGLLYKVNELGIWKNKFCSYWSKVTDEEMCNKLDSMLEERKNLLATFVAINPKSISSKIELTEIVEKFTDVEARLTGLKHYELLNTQTPQRVGPFTWEASKLLEFASDVPPALLKQLEDIVDEYGGITLAKWVGRASIMKASKVSNLTQLGENKSQMYHILYDEYKSTIEYSSLDKRRKKMRRKSAYNTANLEYQQTSQILRERDELPAASIIPAKVTFTGFAPAAKDTFSATDHVAREVTSSSIFLNKLVIIPSKVTFTGIAPAPLDGCSATDHVEREVKSSSIFIHKLAISNNY